ncbi:MAG: hypothetical protein J6N15_05405 [Ruminiclostridium sp.]|nr:hypothetical protein [Ruminiclostridium sp.]
MLPAAVKAGVSFSDFWKMTIGEISDVLEYHRKCEEEREKTETRRAAFISFWGGYYSRINVKMPQTVVKAFPEIFGRTKGGGIKAENWQECERALMQIAANFKKRGAETNGGSG